MKRMFVSVALVALLVATSCAGLGSKSETDIAYKKQEAPQRQGWDNDWHGPLYGEVESLTYAEYSLADKFWEIVKGKCREKSVYKFNLKGDVVEWAKYNDDGSLREKEVYKYDSQGNIIETVGYKGEIMIPSSMEERIIVYRK